MKNCTHCKHADWQRTESGKLPPLPASKWWQFGHAPVANGGLINRRKDLSDHCTYYTRSPA
jgi:hypothetical protein